MTKSYEKPVEGKHVIDITKRYTTVEGLPVRLYAGASKGGYPVHGAVLLDGVWVVHQWDAHGGAYYGIHSIVPVIERRAYWVNILECPALNSGVQCVTYKTRDKADLAAAAYPNKRLACQLLAWDEHLDA